MGVEPRGTRRSRSEPIILRRASCRTASRVFHSSRGVASCGAPHRNPVRQRPLRIAPRTYPALGETRDMSVSQRESCSVSVRAPSRGRSRRQSPYCLSLSRRYIRSRRGESRVRKSAVAATVGVSLSPTVNVGTSVRLSGRQIAGIRSRTGWARNLDCTPATGCTPKPIAHASFDQDTSCSRPRTSR